MATLNLLTGSYSGKLGATTGATWHGKHIIKSKIWSKAPPTAAQTAALRAFVGLNRVSAAIAAADFPSLGLSAAGMLPHNAVAHWLKPAVHGHVFSPSNISAVIPDDGAVSVRSMIYNYISHSVTVSVAIGAAYVPYTGSVLYLVFFDADGVVYFARTFDPSDFSVDFLVSRAPGQQYYCLAFVSDPVARGRFVHGFSLCQRWFMQYSLTEQGTDELWLDGKMIFRRSWRVPTENMSTQSLNSLINLTAAGVFDIVRWECHANARAAGSTGNMGQLQAAWPSSDRFPGSPCILYFSGTHEWWVSWGQLSQAQMAAWQAAPAYITVWYTRS